MPQVPDQLQRQITIAATQQQVWDAITTSELLAQWFSTEVAEINPEPGGVGRFDWGEGADEAVVETVEPMTRFAYRWRPAGSDRRHTLVVFELAAKGDSTEVTVTESGFASLPDEDRQRSFDDNNSGWKAELAELADLVESA